MDCDTTRDHGCQGGLMDFAFSFIIENGGLDTERDYKYKAQQGTCNLAKEKRHVVTIDNYEDVPPNDEVALRKARSLAPGGVCSESGAGCGGSPLVVTRVPRGCAEETHVACPHAGGREPAGGGRDRGRRARVPAVPGRRV